ncbi:MAG: hypothetical protein ACLFV7_03690 [Phycisphaerae bacterium]
MGNLNEGTLRHVPLLLKAQLRLGHPVALVGWMFFGIGMVFWWTFGVGADFSELTVFRGDLTQAKGRIVDVEETGTVINERRVYRFHYNFTAPDGYEYQGASYHGRMGTYDANRPVRVEFPAEDPNSSRIVGMTHGIFPWWTALIAAVFPTVGLAVALPFVFLGARKVRTLRNGKLTTGFFVDAVPTGVVMNNCPVYKYRFRFTDEQGMEHFAVVKTHRPEAIMDGWATYGADEAETIQDEYAEMDGDARQNDPAPQGGEPLLYDPADPGGAVLLDSLPGGASLDFDGKLHTGSVIRGVLGVAVPLLAITVHGGIWIYRIATR